MKLSVYLSRFIEKVFERWLELGNLPHAVPIPGEELYVIVVVEGGRVVL